MAKTSINTKAIQQFILESRENGKSDQEIYDALSQQYYDKKSVALLITGTATNENKSKYKIQNNILIGFLGLSMLLKILIIFSLSDPFEDPFFMLLLFLYPAIEGYFIYGIAKYLAPYYKLCGILAILSFLKTIRSAGNDSSIILNLLIISIIVGLSFYLAKKLFPKYSPKNLKKDDNGEYILE
jgi:hypothetical protein